MSFFCSAIVDTKNQLKEKVAKNSLHSTIQPTDTQL